jgi:hypothetical protein
VRQVEEPEKGNWLNHEWDPPSKRRNHWQIPGNYKGKTGFNVKDDAIIAMWTIRLPRSERAIPRASISQSLIDFVRAGLMLFEFAIHAPDYTAGVDHGQRADSISRD